MNNTKLFAAKSSEEVLAALREMYKVERTLTTKQKRALGNDLKAHNVHEALKIKVGYVEVNGIHHYLFLTETNAQLFDKLVAS